MCKAICGVASGACGGAINLYWAKGSDISDINAKFGAQVRRTGLLTMMQNLLHFFLIAHHLTGQSIYRCSIP
jgi:hypothetical protein